MLRICKKIIALVFMIILLFANIKGKVLAIDNTRITDSDWKIYYNFNNSTVNTSKIETVFIANSNYTGMRNILLNPVSESTISGYDENTRKAYTEVIKYTLERLNNLAAKYTVGRVPSDLHMLRSNFATRATLLQKYLNWNSTLRNELTEQVEITQGKRPASSESSSSGGSTSSGGGSSSSGGSSSETSTGILAGTSGGSVEPVIDPITNPDYYKPSDNTSDTKAANIGRTLVAGIQTIGVVISVVGLMVIGIRYIFASVEEKANYKETMIPYIIGIVMLFSITSILQIIYDLVTKLA